MSGYITATFSQEKEQRALELIAELKEILPFVIKLSANDRKTMPKMDDGRLPFVEKSLNYGKQQPLIIPPFTSIEELTNDLGLFNSTRLVAQELNSLSEMVNDTRTAVGSDAYQAALSIYNSAKGAVKMGIPGTQSIVDELGKLFTGQGAAKSQQPAE
jgi:hypothetical protein